MARVTGIGGIFFKAKDREAVQKWYHDNLGLEISDYGGWSFLWRDKGDPDRVGRTEWAPFDDATDYFDPSESAWMINYRVDDLDGLLETLRARGVWVSDKTEEYEFGKFGWIMDPEGNKIELWEPMGEE